MKNTILCSSNPILIKNLYGILRDQGHQVEIIEHPAVAVQKVMARKYDFLIIDTAPFGLSAEDAINIIKMVAPRLPILSLGTSGDSQSESALDLEEFKRMIDSISQMA